MRRYFIHLSYCGSAYCGYQIQPNAPTIQGELERCLSLKLGQTIAITGCGRTDTGVHARNYYAHFDIDEPIADPVVLCERLNVFLPYDIVIHRIWEVDPSFHARFDATSRTYHYYISRIKDPFHHHDAYAFYGALNLDAMRRAADALFEYHDFTSFSKLHTQVKTNNCKILETSWSEEGSLLVFRIKADRFLRNMVRAVVGTLLEVGRGRLDLEGFHRVIQKKNRCSAGTSMPAHALFLEEVGYPEHLFEGVSISSMTMEKLKDILASEGHSCVLFNGEQRCFDRRGVIDLLKLYDEEPSVLHHAIIADKVVGKGAAALMVAGGVREVYGEVMSMSALDLLQQHGVKASYGVLVPHVINREGDGVCPVETLCAEVSEIETMITKIRTFLDSKI